ncbi:protein OCTOPUS [Quercus robur]|uniref:protein OCTOPUS n=1 Tax=Quercus robur TaxID=38942 RepID=UPI0021637D85|nr:protein OCTOPUS [Quercus robur]
MTSHSHSQPRCIRVSRCHRHPSKPITGFCASCLRERLASIDSATRHEIPIPTASSSSAALRRTKSYSASSSAAVSDPPRRKSCDVRSRNTLSDLFSIHDHDHDHDAVPGGFEVEELGFQLREEDENEEQQEEDEDEEEEEEEEEEIRVSEAPNVQEDENVELKTMKEFIDLEWQTKKRNGGMDFRHIVWEAASVFTKKLSKWRRKQSKKNTKNDCDTVDADINRRARPWRETQSEIGDYGFGRRSCDMDPRFSVDAAAARYSFDEPRASWDGYVIGAKAFPNPNPRQLSPLVSVVEDVNQSRLSLDLTSPPPPGGSAQTKDYYSEMSRTTRRRSFDRSNSLCNKEVDDLKLISNAKVSPATTELFYGAKLLIADQNLRDTNGSESVHSGSKDSVVSQSGFNKLGKWNKVRNIFNFKPHRRRNDRNCENGNEEKCVGGNVVDRSSFGESWQKLRRVANGEANGNGSVSQKLIRSYSVSCRNPCKVAGLFNHAETKANGVKRREEVILQHSRSARYSPNNLDHNGLLRFYLTPLRSYRRSKSGKSKLRSSSSIARTVL